MNKHENSTAPKCDEQGRFLPRQCDATQCWCVHLETGELIKRTIHSIENFPYNCNQPPGQYEIRIKILQNLTYLLLYSQMLRLFNT